jgi:predicted amidohydrolase
MPESTVKVAAVQAAPVFLDTEASLAKALTLIEKAAAEGARLIVFPETFLPTWPAWVDEVLPGEDAAWHLRLLEQSVVVPGPVTERLGAAARAAGAQLVMGIDEREQHGGTVYNTLLYFDADGRLLGKHRKLVPTHAERLVWGMGDGSDLQVHQTTVGRVGGLICWENYMPLARFAIYAQGVDIWVAPTLATHEPWVATMRHIAREGVCHVIGRPAQAVSGVAPAGWWLAGSVQRLSVTLPGRSPATLPHGDEPERSAGRAGVGVVGVGHPLHRLDRKVRPAAAPGRPDLLGTLTATTVGAVLAAGHRGRHPALPAVRPGPHRQPHPHLGAADAAAGRRLRGGGARARPAPRAPVEPGRGRGDPGRLGTLTGELLDVVHQTIQPTQAALWLRTARQGRD